jgi:hypothetical protein
MVLYFNYIRNNEDSRNLEEFTQENYKFASSEESSGEDLTASKNYRETYKYYVEYDQILNELIEDNQNYDAWKRLHDLGESFIRYLSRSLE